jgi:rsbT co-antagonist protein RsbR
MPAENMVDELDDELLQALRARATAVIDDWERAVAAAQRTPLPDAALHGELTALYDAVIRGLDERGGADRLGEARALLAEMSHSRARQGFTPTETAAAVFLLKRAIRSVIGTDHALAYVALSELIDELGLFTFETYSAAREDVIVNQTEQLLELSTPVVKLWDGILAVPLVGTLDSARTQVVMETLLQTLVDTGSGHAIIDITGVAAVDTQVAQHLLKTVVAARLMGAECIISGIRPQIAQTVVALGIEFGDIPTRAALADALRHVLHQRGYDVVRRTDAATIADPPRPGAS